MTEALGTLFSAMCGICGLYSPSGSPQASLVDDMRARVAHRGPDEGGTEALGVCVLGHQRLRVLDPELGFQPVTNETGDVVAVFNGELYNFAELRDALAAHGHDVRGRGDTPVIPHLYEQYGPAFVERRDGICAGRAAQRWAGRSTGGPRSRCGTVLAFALCSRAIASARTRSSGRALR